MASVRVQTKSPHPESLLALWSMHERGRLCIYLGRFGATQHYPWIVYASRSFHTPYRLASPTGRTCRNTVASACLGTHSVRKGVLDGYCSRWISGITIPPQGGCALISSQLPFRDHRLYQRLCLQRWRIRTSGRLDRVTELVGYFSTLAVEARNNLRGVEEVKSQVHSELNLFKASVVASYPFSQRIIIQQSRPW